MLRRLRNWEKCASGATDGDIGHVDDLIFDDLAWGVRYQEMDLTEIAAVWRRGSMIDARPVQFSRRCRLR